jgi:hypothetical protein
MTGDPDIPSWEAAPGHVPRLPQRFSVRYCVQRGCSHDRQQQQTNLGSAG